MYMQGPGLEPGLGPGLGLGLGRDRGARAAHTAFAHHPAHRVEGPFDDFAFLADEDAIEQSGAEDVVMRCAWHSCWDVDASAGDIHHLNGNVPRQLRRSDGVGGHTWCEYQQNVSASRRAGALSIYERQTREWCKQRPALCLQGLASRHRMTPSAWRCCSGNR